jgi:ATP-dependent DNA helicase RecG
VAVDDLEGAVLARFRERAARSKRLGTDVLEEDDPGLIEKLRLMEGKYLKRAAILLFYPDPERFVTGASVKIGYFETDAELRYHDEVHGNLFAQVDKTMDLLLTKYLKASISYEGVQRVETYPVPEDALRETLLNAIVHRDYAIAAPVQIRVYADRLSIWNPGELPDNWSPEKLLGPHSSRPFNPDVANAFFGAGEIEAWGRGIQRVLNACHEARTPEPRIEVEAGELSVEFPFSAAYVDRMAAQETAQETTRETTQEQILSLLREDPTLTRKALADRIGITADGVKYHLDRLRDAGRIRHVGPTKKGRWEVIGPDEGRRSEKPTGG